MNFWETDDWIRVKTFIATTDKLLSRVEYLKMMGHKNYSDQSYQNYLKAMAEKPKEIKNDSIQKLAD